MLAGGDMRIDIKNREVIILLVVSLMAFAANLPDGMLGNLVDRNLLLVTLTVTVVIALFRYLRLMLFITVSILAIGANLPDQLAGQLGISRPALIVASGVLVFVTLLYKLYQLHVLRNTGARPEGVVPYKHDSIQSRHDVIAAILNGDLGALHQLLISDVEINFSQEGQVPIYLAIEKGHADMVLLLLFYGAKLRVRNKMGLTPIEFALLHKNPRVAKIIHYASRQDLSIHREPSSQNQKNKIVVLFADICGSTALYDQLGNDTALHVITRTLNILIQEVVSHKGTLIKTIGDEIMCSFPSVSVATKAACAMQSALDAQRPGGEHPIFVRIGFHYGEVIHKANDVFGDTVNVAARVASITRARQILTTQAVLDALPLGLADIVRPITRAEFHGKQDALTVFQVLWEPENTRLGRIGDAIFRKPYEAGNESFMGNPDMQKAVS
jgi:class 3 adenylate cyclase